MTFDPHNSISPHTAAPETVAEDPVQEELVAYLDGELDARRGAARRATPGRR